MRGSYYMHGLDEVDFFVVLLCHEWRALGYTDWQTMFAVLCLGLA